MAPKQTGKRMRSVSERRKGESSSATGAQSSATSEHDPRIIWVKGDERPGPRQVIGVLELRGDDRCRAVFAERTQVDGRCHVLLARGAWGGKDDRSTRWWSLVIDENHKVNTIRNGSCGDALTTADVSRIIRALEELDLITRETMIAVDDGPSVFPCLARRQRPEHG